MISIYFLAFLFLLIQFLTRILSIISRNEQRNQNQKILRYFEWCCCLHGSILHCLRGIGPQYARDYCHEILFKVASSSWGSKTSQKDKFSNFWRILWYAIKNSNRGSSSKHKSRSPIAITLQLNPSIILEVNVRSSGP